jgi:hypothetical protein
MFPILENLEEQISPLNLEQRSRLEKAHLLVSKCQFKLAANIFADLSVEMEDANHPHYAAVFHTQAAYAFADCQFEEAALSHARTALHLYFQCHLEKRAKVFYFNIIQILANRDMKIAMTTLQHEFGEKLGAIQENLSAYLVTSPIQLPTNCPKCGAPINSREVHWLDKDTAECNYCGSRIRSDN